MSADSSKGSNESVPSGNNTGDSGTPRKTISELAGQFANPSNPLIRTSDHHSNVTDGVTVAIGRGVNEVD